jgi:hypothetical protein
MRSKIVHITKGIKFSKPNTTWLCSWCEKHIKKGEESILFSALDHWSDGTVYQKGFGARIHLECLEPMCAEIKDAVKNKTKYAIFNNLEQDTIR